MFKFYFIQILGKVAKVKVVREDGDLEVQIQGQLGRWTLNPDCCVRKSKPDRSDDDDSDVDIDEEAGIVRVRVRIGNHVFRQRNLVLSHLFIFISWYSLYAYC